MRRDLRAAWFMDNSLAGQRAGRTQPASCQFIRCGGPGPEPVWDPEWTASPLRTERQIIFKLRGRKSPLAIADQHFVVIVPYLSPDASKWYERHLARESELHELILDSAYGGKAAISSTIAGGKIAATTSAGLVVGIGGTVLGAGIIYYANSARMVEAGLAIAGTSILKGMEISREGYRESASKLKQELDPSITYRFVRFLPEYLWMGWSDQAIAYPVELRTSSSKIRIQQPSVVNGTSVSVSHLPDMRLDRPY